MRNQRGDARFYLLGSILLFCVAVSVAAAVFSVMSSLGKDSTDPVDGRSGMVLYVDAATGCNYLSSGRQYGITPRLRADGSIWCDLPAQRAQ